MLLTRCLTMLLSVPSFLYLSLCIFDNASKNLSLFLTQSLTHTHKTNLTLTHSLPTTHGAPRKPLMMMMMTHKTNLTLTHSLPTPHGAPRKPLVAMRQKVTFRHRIDTSSMRRKARKRCDDHMASSLIASNRFPPSLSPTLPHSHPLSR